MDFVVVLQIRMGSSRLPGKAMLPLDGEPAIVHEIRRAATSTRFDREDVVVATSEMSCDDVLAMTADCVGAGCYRGSEADVIRRIHRTVETVGADAAVRVCGDNTLIDPRLPEILADRLESTGANYVSTKFERTFPVGHSADAFTRGAIERAATAAANSHHREHVAQFFKDERDQYDWENVTATEVFDPEFVERVPDFASLRLTMDEAADYRLLSRIYQGLDYDRIVGTTDAIEFVLENDLRHVNENVEQAAW